MRVGPIYEGATERIGAMLNLVPVPIGLSLYGMPVRQLPGLALLRAERSG